VYDVLRFAAGAVREALEAAADLAVARGLPAPTVGLEDEEVVAAFESERRLRAPGLEGVSGFAELSRFAATDGGWIRLHANFPHHRAALLRVLGEDDPLGTAARWDALELEDAIVAQGGCAAAVRTAQEWDASPQGRAVAPEPVLVIHGGARPLAAPERLPASGIRVLDLTRVIAGPVGTRYLAALGAEVVRIDPPALPELPLQVADGVVGKRLVERDLRAEPLHDDELADFDVVVQGYRPGALDALGLSGDALAAHHPHITLVQLSAWGWLGPWGTRRGFDSLVQAAVGIADELRAPDGTPGALPVQALDHATGYRIATAALRGLARRARGGGAEHTKLALAQTAADLMALERTDTPWPSVDGPALQELPDGRAVVPPPGSLDGRPLRF
jgi:crotonobetainyl-CoA:carnitine CoA-transferase CaiB-like acyl-CoA transferase